jgi:hypothetical protein
MSDIKDSVDEAVALQRKLAAGTLRRVEELQAEVDKRTRDRASLDGLPDDPAVTSLRNDLDAKLADLNRELALAREQLGAAREEIKALGRLDARSDMAMVEGLMAEDPVIRTPEQIALDNVREHVKNVDAQVRVGKELAALEQPERAPPAAAPGKPSREEADAQAKAEFEALRAARMGDGKPKKTL